MTAPRWAADTARMRAMRVLRLVVHVAKRYQRENSPLTLPDLVQENEEPKQLSINPEMKKLRSNRTTVREIPANAAQTTCSR